MYIGHRVHNMYTGRRVQYMYNLYTWTVGHPVYQKSGTPCILGQWETLYAETVGHPVYSDSGTPCILGQWDILYAETVGHLVYWDSGTPCIKPNYSRLRRKCEIFCLFHTALQTLANLWVILHNFFAYLKYHLSIYLRSAFLSSCIYLQ